MKRILTVIALCVMTFWGSHTLRAGDFGVVAGAGFTSIKNVSTELATGYHAGITYKFHLPVGFAFQPSLLYNMKTTQVDEVLAGQMKFDYKMGYLELPLSLQWGPDLLLFRFFRHLKTCLIVSRLLRSKKLTGRCLSRLRRVMLFHAARNAFIFLRLL